jgi:hypothetical protein
MAKWNMKLKYYMFAMIVSFVIAAISFSGVILKNDLVGRLIFGFVWVIVGIGWLGQYLNLKNKEKY